MGSVVTYLTCSGASRRKTSIRSKPTTVHCRLRRLPRLRRHANHLCKIRHVTRKRQTIYRGGGSSPLPPWGHKIQTVYPRVYMGIDPRAVLGSVVTYLTCSGASRRKMSFRGKPTTIHCRLWRLPPPTAARQPPSAAFSLRQPLM